MLSEKFTKKSHRRAAKADRNNQPTATKGVQLKRRKLFAGGADSTSFDPKDITGLFLWLRADNAIDTFIADGDVTAWSDESGNDNDCTIPSIALERPHWTENVFGTKPAITFDGVNDYLTTTGMRQIFIDDSSDTDFTVILMIKPTSVQTDDQAIFSQYANQDWTSTSVNLANVLSMGIDADSKSTILGTSTTGDVAIGSTLSNPKQYIMVARYEHASTTMRHFLNGTLKSTVTDWVRGTGGMGGGHPKIGAMYTSSRGAVTTSNEYTGHIAEIIVYDSALSEENLKHAQNYLIYKYTLSKMPTPRLG